VVPSEDGASFYYVDSEQPGILRVEKSGLNEELVYKFEGTGLIFLPLLAFPSGKDLLAGGFRGAEPYVRLNRISLASHEAFDLGEISCDPNNFVFDWAEPGKSILLSRTVDGLTNIWRYSLQDRSLTQITFGPGPDYSPMSDHGGKGIYYVNGKSSGFLTAYHVRSKESTDIVSENASKPAISPDGKRVMYITSVAPEITELWVSDIDGGGKVKIAIGIALDTEGWAADNFHLSFSENGASTGPRSYIVGADGTGLLQLPPIRDMRIVGEAVWSQDQKSIYISGLGKTVREWEIWKWNMDSMNAEKFVDKCGYVTDADPNGKYLLGAQVFGEKTGVYEVSVSDKKCILLLPGVVTYATYFAHDGKSFLYAVISHGEVTIYRQPWKDGRLIGASQVALKVPFAFPVYYLNGNAYDFTRDLSAIVYARPRRSCRPLSSEPEISRSPALAA